MGVLKVAVPSLNVLPLNAWEPTSLIGFSTENAIATLGTDCVTLQGDGSGMPPALLFDPVPLPPGTSVFTYFKLTVQGRRVAGAGGSGGLLTLAARSWASGSPRSTWGISSTGEVFSDATLDEWQTLVLDHVYLQGFFPSGGDALQLVVQGSFGIDDDNVFEFRHLNLLPSATTDYEDHSPVGWRKVGCGGDAGSVGRLRLWDGTQWLRERCDDDTGTPVTNTESFAGTGNYPTGPIVTDSITWEEQTPNYGRSSGTLIFDGHDFDLTNSAGRVVLPAEGPDGTMTVTDLRIQSGTYYTGVCWRVSPAPNLDSYWCLRSNGDVQRVSLNTLDPTVYLACGAVPDHATVEITTAGDLHTVTINSTVMGSFTDAFNNTESGWGVIADNGGGFGQVESFSVTSSAPILGHPLKVWDGSTWQTAACMVPA